MAKAKTKCIDPSALLLELDEALYALDRVQRKAKKIQKKNKKAIDALLRLEASIEDAIPCDLSNKGKSKKKKKKKSKKVAMKQNFSGNSVANDVIETASNEPDDLELIAGVGPTLAAKLNDLGVHRYEEIAAWQDDDIKRIDLHLNFPGRIIRENWVEQAKALAKGGRDEYVRVFGKEPR